MALSTLFPPRTALAIGATIAGIVTAATAPSAAGGSSPAWSPGSGPSPIRHEHTVDTHPLEATFHCGDLRLRVTGGTETETFDGDLREGVARVSISRIWRRVTLAGSDGRTYRASAATVAWFVLKAPDFEHPVRGLEVVQVFFRGGPQKSPGYIRETIRIKHGHETDVVSGPCDF